MTGDVENLILEHLRAIRADVSETKARLEAVERVLQQREKPE